MKKYGSILCSSMALLVIGTMQMAHADLSISDEIVMTGENVVSPFGDPSNFGTAGPDNSAAFRYTARERDDPSQLNRRAATFLLFDTSSLTEEDVNAAGFSATFEIEHVGRLNGINNGMDLMFGQVSGGNWDDNGSNNPDFAWGLNSTNQMTLLSDVLNYASSTNLTLDVTDIVKDWVLGNTSNQGITLFALDNGGNASQASYLQNASITTIPEPSTLGLMGIMGGGLLLIRRKLMV